MNELTLFNNPDFGEVRTLETNDGKVLFCGKDVATALGYVRTADAIRNHCKGVVEMETPSNGGIQKMKFITESDVYRLTFSSKLPDAEKFTDWITEEVIPSIMRTGSYSINGKAKKESRSTEKRLEIQEMNARSRMASMYMKLAGIKTKSETYKDVLVAKAAEVLSGEQLLPLPKSEQRMYTATEIGEMFGVSAQKVGTIANKNGMKTKEYGEWYKDKAKNADKEVDVFKYNDKAVDKFKELLKN